MSQKNDTPPFAPYFFYCLFLILLLFPFLVIEQFCAIVSLHLPLFCSFFFLDCKLDF